MAFPNTWVTPAADGRLEVFVVGTTGDRGVDLWHLYQTSPAGAWSQWVNHGSPGTHNNWNNPVVARDSDGRLELFMGFDAQTWQIWQTSPNGPWTPTWTEHPVTAGDIGTSVGALTLRPDGRLQLFVNGVISAQRDELWHIVQTAPSQGWTSWASLGIPAGLSGLGPTGGSKSSASAATERCGTSGKPRSTAAGRTGYLTAPQREPP
jgi:hypothetical protein